MRQNISIRSVTERQAADLRKSSKNIRRIPRKFCMLSSRLHYVQKKITHSHFLLYLPGKCSDFPQIFEENI